MVSFNNVTIIIIIIIIITCAKVSTFRKGGCSGNQV